MSSASLRLRIPFRPASTTPGGQPKESPHANSANTASPTALTLTVADPNGTTGPLFFTHYSFMGYDPHVTDKYADYFTNNRNASLIQQRFAIENPAPLQGLRRQRLGHVRRHRPARLSGEPSAVAG